MSCMLEAHRGVAKYYPQNTMAAFVAAKELGYGMIELDPRFTADDRCVILHNKTINATARREDGSKLEEETPILSLTLEEARAYDYGLYMGEQFRGVQIPTLEEVLAFAIEQKIPLKFDNIMQSHPEKHQEVFFSTVEQMGAIDYIGFTASKIDFIKKLIARFPTVQIHYDGDITESALAEVASIVPAEQLTVWLRYHNEHTAWAKTPAADAALCAMTHRYAKRVGLWLLDDPAELAEADSWGVDIVETDGTLQPAR